MTNIAFHVLWFGAFLIAVVYVSHRFRRSEAQFYALLGLTGDLRMRVFEQEIRQLQSPGIFVHEETAERLASMMLAMLSVEQKEKLQEDYEGHCPSHIPLWKYSLYNYSFNMHAEPRYEVRVTSVPELRLREYTQAVEDLKRDTTTSMGDLCDALHRELMDLKKDLQQASQERSSTEGASGNE